MTDSSTSAPSSVSRPTNPHRSTDGPSAARATYAMRLGDDALVLAQRMGQWIAAAPQLEEDVALANIGLDLLGQARTLLSYAGQADGTGRTEDDLAYLRDERDFLNCQLVELPNTDFAASMARLLVFASYQRELYARLSGSSDETLAAVAAKAVKEVDYHRDHATQWVLRLGDGTDDSHARMQSGLDAVWPYVGELFDADSLTGELSAAGTAVDPATLREPVLAYVGDVLDRATLARPDTHVRHSGGRRGVHTEHMGYLLAELQHLARSHPGATW
ncbi:MAG: 1,2-phenylacetyl-CoA epoxidase subunit PaaC [Nocardioidaceae bacterium]